MATKSPNEDVPMLLVETRRLVREGLCRILAETPYKIHWEAENFETAEALLKDGAAPRLVLLDFEEDDDQDSAGINHLRANLPDARIVVLTNDVTTRKLVTALEAGVDAYLLKDMSPEALIQSLSLTMLGEKVFPTNLARLLIDGGLSLGDSTAALSCRGLSEREVQILRCLVSGDPNKIIANRLRITEATVKVHLKGILRKIKASNRTQAAIWAVEQGIDKYPLSLI